MIDTQENIRETMDELDRMYEEVLSRNPNIEQELDDEEDTDD